MIEENIIASAGSKSNSLVIKKTEWEGQRMVDVRKYYYNKSKKEFSPTRKGISLTHDNFSFIKQALLEHEPEIQEWLCQDVSDAVMKNADGQAQARQKAKSSSRKIKLKLSNWKSPEIFEFESEGGTVTLTYNESHRFHNSLRLALSSLSPEQSDKVSHIIDSLLVSFGRAMHLCEDAPIISPDALLDNLIFNWGLILNNTLNES
jgi:hypothetical protein